MRVFKFTLQDDTYIIVKTWVSILDTIAELLDNGYVIRYYMELYCIDVEESDIDHYIGKPIFDS